MGRIIPKHNHDHYFIQYEVLYESYNTIRGLRCLRVMEVRGLRDADNVTKAEIEYIEKMYCN